MGDRSKTIAIKTYTCTDNNTSTASYYWAPTPTNDLYADFTIPFYGDHSGDSKAIIIDDNTLVKIGDKMVRWGDIARKLEIILEILKDDIEIYEIADSMVGDREEDIKLT